MGGMKRSNKAGVKLMKTHVGRAGMTTHLSEQSFVRIAIFYRVIA